MGGWWRGSGVLSFGSFVRRRLSRARGFASLLLSVGARAFSGGVRDGRSVIVTVRHRGENVVMAMVAPVKVDTCVAVADPRRVLIRSMEDDRVAVAARNDVRMLLVAPFPVRAECAAEVVGISPRMLLRGSKSWRKVGRYRRRSRLTVR